MTSKARRTRRGSSENAGNVRRVIGLSDLAIVVARSVASAKRRIDEEAVAVAREYGADPVLRLIPPPAFTFAEVRVAVKIAIAVPEWLGPATRRKTAGGLAVYVDVASLKDLAPHLVSEIEFRIGPTKTSAHPTDNEHAPE